MWILSEVMPVEYRSCIFWLKLRGKDVAVAVGKTGIDISTDYGNKIRHYVSGCVAEGKKGIGRGQIGLPAKVVVNYGRHIRKMRCKVCSTDWIT